jgi:cobalt/nickel transport system permease protein
MHLWAIDQIANDNRSFFHGAGVPSKLLLVLVFLGGFIMSNHIVKLGVLMGILVLLFIVARVPVVEIGHLILYPAFFSLLFALLKMQESWVAGLMIIFRGVGAALATLFLLFTTPSVEIFAFLSIFLPRLFVDILLFTYRSFFILIDEVENLLRNIKLRGGYHPFNFFMNIKNMAAMVGLVIVHSFDMSERMYKIYLLRGYNGGIPTIRKWWSLTYVDSIIMLFSVFLLFGMVFLWNL